MRMNNRGSAGRPNDTQWLAARIQRSRANLLWVVALTAINVVFAFLQSGFSFLFTASAPTLLVQLGQMSLYYLDSTSLFLFCAAAAIIVIGLYGLFFLLAKKRAGFLLAALILFALDTLLLLWLLFPDFGLDGILNLFFHAWVIFDLTQGVIAWNTLRRLPKEPEVPPAPPPPSETPPAESDGWSLPSV